MPRLPETTHQKIIKLRTQGSTYRQIAKSASVSVSTVINVLKKHRQQKAPLNKRAEEKSEDKRSYSLIERIKCLLGI
jgi:transposase